MTEEAQKGGSQTMAKLKMPSMYNVVMHNDDETTMDFVVKILVDVFHKTKEEASSLMIQVHFNGKAVVGTYYRDIAKSKVIMATRLARKNRFPLRFTVEEA